MKIIIHQTAGVDYPAEMKGNPAHLQATIKEVRKKLHLRPYPQDTVDIFEDEPDEIGQLANPEQKTEIELLRDRYASMAANPPLTAYAHNDKATVEDYEGMMKDLERQLREAGAMP